jgi:hypothetical protein
MPEESIPALFPRPPAISANYLCYKILKYHFDHRWVVLRDRISPVYPLSTASVWRRPQYH